MSTLRLLVHSAAVALAAACSVPAGALEFEPTPQGDIIRATGPIEPGDADKFRKIVTPDYLYRYGLRRGATLHISSPGGSVVAGIELANAIRERGLMTHVSADSGCYSACTFVFLGGVKRTVLGKFGIHAMSKGRRDGGGILVYSDTDFDAVQLLASTLINLAQSLVGDARMITAMLTVPSAGIRLVPDNFLADWRIITTASRPTQRMNASFNCASGSLSEVEKMVCDNLTLADADRRLAAAYSFLSKKNVVPDLAENQERWRKYRESCPNVLAPNRDEDVLACVREAYEIRLKQLEGLMSFHDASSKGPAVNQWKPHPPLEELNTLRLQR